MFEILAKANPQAASFVATKTDLVDTLSATPGLVAKPGEKSFGEQVRTAFRNAENAGFASGRYTPTQLRNASAQAKKAVGQVVDANIDPLTGDPAFLFTGKDFEAVVQFELDGNSDKAEAVLGEGKFAAYLNSPTGQATNAFQSILGVIRKQGGFVNEDKTPFTPEQQIDKMIEIEQRLNSDPAAVLEMRALSAQMLLDIRRLEFANDTRDTNEGKLLTDDQRTDRLLDIEELGAEIVAGEALVAGLKKMMEFGEDFPPKELLLLGSRGGKYRTPVGLKEPIMEIVMTRPFHALPAVIIALEGELAETRMLILGKQMRLKRGRDVGEAEAESRDPASAEQTAADLAATELEDGGGGGPSLPPMTAEQAKAATDTILRGLGLLEPLEVEEDNPGE